MPVPRAEAVTPTEPTEAGLQLFRTKVRPMLTARCLECHGGKRTKGNFDMRTRDGWLKKAKHDTPMVPFASEKSHVMLQVQHLEKPKMPPKEFLTVEQILDLGRWIDQGAPYDAPLVWEDRPAR